MVEQDGEVDEVAYPRVLAIPEVAEHAVELLRRMSVDVNCFNHHRRDTGKVQRAGDHESVSGMKLVDPRGNVELDAPELLVAQVRADFGTPGGEAAVIIAQSFRWADCEDEVVVVQLGREDVDQSFMQVRGGGDIIAQTKINIFRKAGVVA